MGLLTCCCGGTPGSPCPQCTGGTLPFRRVTLSGIQPYWTTGDAQLVANSTAIANYLNGTHDINVLASGQCKVSKTASISGTQQFSTIFNNALVFNGVQIQVVLSFGVFLTGLEFEIFLDSTTQSTGTWHDHIETWRFASPPGPYDCLATRSITNGIRSSNFAPADQSPAQLIIASGATGTLSPLP